METCKHNWFYVHEVFQGRMPDGVAVVRYCENCQTVQMAFAAKWVEPPKEYDISDVVPFLQQKCTK